MNYCYYYSELYMTQAIIIKLILILLFMKKWMFLFLRGRTGVQTTGLGSPDMDPGQLIEYHCSYICWYIGQAYRTRVIRQGIHLQRKGEEPDKRMKRSGDQPTIWHYCILNYCILYNHSAVQWIVTKILLGLSKFQTRLPLFFQWKLGTYINLESESWIKSMIITYDFATPSSYKIVVLMKR